MILARSWIPQQFIIDVIATLASVIFLLFVTGLFLLIISAVVACIVSVIKCPKE